MKEIMLHRNMKAVFDDPSRAYAKAFLMIRVKSWFGHKWIKCGYAFQDSHKYSSFGEPIKNRPKYIINVLLKERAHAKRRKNENQKMLRQIDNFNK